MRIMAIDLGDARTGLAVSDAMGILCGEAWTMEEWDMERAAKRIAEAAKERGVERLVLGLPKNMDGSEGVRAEKSRRFKEMLEAECALPVVLWDERRSSIEAHAILHAAGKKEKKRYHEISSAPPPIPHFGPSFSSFRGTPPYFRSFPSKAISLPSPEFPRILHNSLK